MPEIAEAITTAAAMCHFQPSRYIPHASAAVAATTAITTAAQK